MTKRSLGRFWEANQAEDSSESEQNGEKNKTDFWLDQIALTSQSDKVEVEMIDKLFV